MWFKQAILYRKAALTALIEAPLGGLAEHCATYWPDSAELDRLLSEALPAIPHCRRLYAVNSQSIQLSGNIEADGTHEEWRGRTLADHDLDAGNLPFRGLVLSSVFLDDESLKRSIAAIHAVGDGNILYGFVVAEFLLDDVPLAETQATGASWTQYRGDPVIRESVFTQKRVKSALDLRIDELFQTLDTLIRQHGIHHIILHFSSSRAIFWVYDDPYSYRFHGVDEILDPEFWLAYPAQPYPPRATVAAEKIRRVLEKFKSLRESDEVIYLRSASLNIINGIIGLTFSCDGSHYISVEEFLTAEHPFWA